MGLSSNQLISDIRNLATSGSNPVDFRIEDSQKEYYIYLYLDPRKPGNYNYDNINLEYEPFYVGKGKGNRIHSHKYKSKDKRRQHMLNKINKIFLETGNEPIKIKYKENLTNEDAYKLEEIVVDKIGRINDNKGPLINKTKGGYGSNGYKYTTETLEKMSKSMLAFYKNNVNPNLGRKNSKESCERISNGRIGIVHGRPTFLKKSQNLNIKPVLQYDLDGNFIREWELLRDIRETLDIGIKNINSCINGKRNTVKGYIWKRKLDSDYPNKIEINFKITKKNV